jgi:hypothetical protein
MMELLAPGSASALAAASARGKTVRLSSPAEMAAATLHLYSGAVLAAPASSSSENALPRSGRRGRIRATLRRWAATPTARMMSRLAPARVRKALKARLR